MNYNDLTPAAKKIMKQLENNKYCPNCKGKGTYFQNTPIGSVEAICFMCEGTGKER